MKRFHTHIAVDDLAANIDFYSKLFGQEPSLIKDDYAKWMLDDPRVNFAISTRTSGQGVNHFGFQADTEDELAVLKQQAEAAMNTELPDPETETCCYAVSSKLWVVDPSGIPWEQYVSMAESETYNKPTADESMGCCTPSAANNAAGNADQQTEAKQGSCC